MFGLIVRFCGPYAEGNEKRESGPHWFGTVIELADAIRRLTLDAERSGSNPIHVEFSICYPDRGFVSDTAGK